MTASRSARWLEPVAEAEVLPALERALAGGPPVAPLPPSPGERERTLEMLRPEQPVSEPDVGAVVATSGSTGAPKGVLLSRSAIRASAEATVRRIGGPGDWALALPDHYVAGLMVLARCLVSGGAAHRVAPDLSDLPAALEQMAGRRYISLVPTQLVRALDDPVATRALAAFDAALIGGAAAEPGVLRRAESAGIRVVTTYGMSETCGGCVYDGQPLDGVEVRLEPGSDRVLLGGPMLFSGYRLRPDLTAEVLTGGTLRTNDRGRIVEGRLTVLGRVDDVVISGGLNVDLAAVERACRVWLAGHGDVAVVGVPDPEWGTRVVAVSDADSLTGLRSFLQSRLPGYAVPRQLLRLGSLPRTSSGKIDRQRLVAAVLDGSAAGTQPGR